MAIVEATIFFSSDFDGVFCLKMGDRSGKEEFVRTCREFWRLMDGL